jgi:phosphatidylglycerol---prolipoprotein diacylglyceryl transferase
MLPILNIGPLAVQTPGLVILIGLWLGLSLAEKYAARRDLPANLLYNLVFVMLVAGVIGARLSYLLRYPEAFASSPLSLLSLNPGLLDSSGGLVVGAIAGLIYAQRKGMPFWRTLDALTPLLMVMAIALGVSHLASGAAFGAATQAPWGIELWGARRHPSQVYEILAAIAILTVLWPGRWSEKTPAGRYFLLFAALTAATRLFLEAFRGDSVLLAGGWRAAQAAAWLILAGSLWGLHRLQTSAKTGNETASSS